MKVALVYDRVNKIGGAERVLQALHRLYPDAPLYTLVHSPAGAPWSRGIKVIPSFFNHLGFLRTRHELLAPVADLAFETFSFDDYQVVISVTSANAKAVITRPETFHLCYCLTPTRYLWQDFPEYQRDWKMKVLPSFIQQRLRDNDFITAQRPDAYLAISQEVKDRIKRHYHRPADVIYPAIDDHFFSQKKPLPFSQRQSYLLVSRLVPYKKVDLAVQVFNRLQLPLTIIGTGSEEERLRRLAQDNITFAGQVSDRQLISHYRRAKALIFPQHEDFGLVPLEAQASGTPVIAYAQGGALETIVAEKTGLFFPQQSVASLLKVVQQFDSGQHHIKANLCLKQAAKFSQTRFNRQFSDKVKTLWQKHQNQHI